MSTWIVIFLLLNLLNLKTICATIESTAILLDCEKDAVIDDIQRTYEPYHTIKKCIRKIRITINITNIGKTPLELAYVYVGHIADPSNGEKMYLSNPLVVRLRQEQVLLAYPFHYLSGINGKASEIVLNYENRKNFTGCDDLSMINPTCGLEHERGRAVPFSEGFCCFCPPTPVNEKHPRGGQDCSLDVGGDPNDMEKQKYKASAHCLHFSDIWYSVSALSEPFILHETFLQVYIEKFRESSSSWFALTNDEDVTLSPQNTYYYDDNGTTVISYITGRPKDSAVTLPINDRRLLTPQPMPAIALSKLQPVIRNGANDYLLLPKDVIDPEGDVCDVAGVSYVAFALQPDRCSVKKDTCLKNQPLDFWEMDNEKRAAGARGDYLLENFGIPYKDPIIVDPETKEHWLALEYHEKHNTLIFVEVNADEIPILAVGKYAQISKITSSTVHESINVLVYVLNGGLMPAQFTIQAVNCAYGVPNSNKESITIAPQMTEEILIMTKQGSTSLYEKFGCSVQVKSDAYGIVAKREVTIHPNSRCICNMFCECTCMSDSLACELMSEEDYQAAGFRGSLPILTAQPPYYIWPVAHPFLAFLSLIMLMLILGLMKCIFGLLGFTAIGHFGLKKVLYRPGKIKSYIQPQLKHYDPEYDDEGYPIDPETGKRVPVVAEELLAFFNVFFLFYWPCLMCGKCFKKTIELKKRLLKKENNGASGEKSEDYSDISNEKDKTGLLTRIFKRNRGKTKDKHSSEQMSDVELSNIERENEELIKPKIEDENKKQNQSYRRGLTINHNIAENEPPTSGPAAKPITKAQAQWQGGKKKINTIPGKSKFFNKD